MSWVREAARGWSMESRRDIGMEGGRLQLVISCSTRHENKRLGLWEQKEREGLWAAGLLVAYLFFFFTKESYTEFYDYRITCIILYLELLLGNKASGLIMQRFHFLIYFRSKIGCETALHCSLSPFLASSHYGPHPIPYLQGGGILTFFHSSYDLIP